jgi:hypothetical protein
MPQAEMWPKDQSAGCQSERSMESDSRQHPSYKNEKRFD